MTSTLTSTLVSSTSLVPLACALPGVKSVFDPSKGYQGLLFHSSRYLGAHELIHVQDIRRDQFRRLAGSLYRDGTLMPDGGQILLGEPVEGMIEVKLGSGQVYIRGAIHDLAARTILIPASGTVIIGSRLTEKTVTWLQDPALKGQAPGTRANNEPMASAFSMITKWGFDGDGEDGALYPIYTVRDGVLVDESAPSGIDPATNLIELYDRHVHGSYIVNGFNVTALGPDGHGNQVFTVSEGVINVYGKKIPRSVSQRLTVKEEPDLELVQAEPVKCVGDGPHSLNTRFGPIADVAQVTILVQKTVTLTHGLYSGAADALPDQSVQEILEVSQPNITYPATAYSLVSNSIAWAGGGKPEPAPGDSYQVTFLCYKVVPPDEVHDRSIKVSGAAPGTTALTYYRFKLPRIDAICMDRFGNLEYVKGISSRLSPQPVEVDPTLIKIADIYVLWGGMPKVDRVGTVHIEQSGLRNMYKMIGDIYASLADLRLKQDITSRDPAAKLGVFSDPLLDDDLRDQGIPQKGAIVNGTLRLPISAITIPLEVPLSTLPFEEEVIIEQSFVTEAHKINPYMAFAPPPVVATLEPSIDIWAEEVTNWTSTDTARFINAQGGIVSNPAIGSQWQVSAQWSEKQILDSRVEAIEFIRQRPVQFKIEGFGPNERLLEVTFDGVAVTP